MSGCTGLTNIDLSGLSNVTQIGNGFLFECLGLTKIYIQKNNEEIFKNVIKSNIEIEIKGSNNNIIIRSFKEDKKRLKNKNYLLKVEEHLELNRTKNRAKNIRYQVKELNNKYNLKLKEDELELCLNDCDPITMEEIKDIPKEKLVLIDKVGEKYYCFDVLILRQYLFKKGNNVYKNPYINKEFKKEDLDKILNVNINIIKYFS